MQLFIKLWQINHPTEVISLDYRKTNRAVIYLLFPFKNITWFSGFSLPNILYMYKHKYKIIKLNFMDGLQDDSQCYRHTLCVY